MCPLACGSEWLHLGRVLWFCHAGEVTGGLVVSSVVSQRWVVWPMKALWQGLPPYTHGSRVWWESDYSSLDVISLSVYQDAAPDVLGYPEHGSSRGAVAVFLYSVFQGVHRFLLFWYRCSLWGFLWR